MVGERESRKKISVCMSQIRKLKLGKAVSRPTGKSVPEI